MRIRLMSLIFDYDGYDDDILFIQRVKEYPVLNLKPFNISMNRHCVFYKWYVWQYGIHLQFDLNMNKSYFMAIHSS